MSNGGFLLRNVLPGITPTCTTLATGYSAGNASNNQPSQYVLSTATTLTVVYDLTTATAMTGASVHNHNMPFTGSTAKVQFCSDGSSWANDETFVIGTPVTTNGITRYPDFYLIFSTTRTYRYVKFTFTVASGTIQIGELFIGKSYQLTKNYDSNFVKFPIMNKTIVANTVMAVSEQTGYALQFSAVPNTIYDAFIDIFRPKHVVFIPNYASGTCYHGLNTDTKVSMPNLAGASTWFGASCNFVSSPVVAT